MPCSSHHALVASNSIKLATDLQANSNWFPKQTFPASYFDTLSDNLSIVSAMCGLSKPFRRLHFEPNSRIRVPDDRRLRRLLLQ